MDCVDDRVLDNLTSNVVDYLKCILEVQVPHTDPVLEEYLAELQWGDVSPRNLERLNDRVGAFWREPIDALIGWLEDGDMPVNAGSKTTHCERCGKIRKRPLKGKSRGRQRWLCKRCRRIW
jgi:hypothetical protein